MTLLGSKHVAILIKLNKVDVFDINLMCYFNTINTSGCLISKIMIAGYEANVFVPCEFSSV